MADFRVCAAGALTTARAGIRLGTVTIMGTVAAGTGLDPERIAGAFLTLHGGAPDAATAEIQLFP